MTEPPGPDFFIGEGLPEEYEDLPHESSAQLSGGGLGDAVSVFDSMLMKELMGLNGMEEDWNEVEDIPDEDNFRDAFRHGGHDLLHAVPDEGFEHGFSDFFDSSNVRVVSGMQDRTREPSDAGVLSFRRINVKVNQLLEGDTLGLVLNGTTVASFGCPEAKLAGWQIGDHIVEVNGRFCSDFEQFADIFYQARCGTFPIVFTVLRQEYVQTICDIDTADISIVEGSLPNDIISASREDNPYIRALRKKRKGGDDLCPEGWNSTAEGVSLPSRLATRCEGIATLEILPGESVPDESYREGTARAASSPWGATVVVFSDDDDNWMSHESNCRDESVRKLVCGPSPCPADRIELCSGTAEAAAPLLPADVGRSKKHASQPNAPCWATDMKICSPIELPHLPPESLNQKHLLCEVRSRSALGPFECSI